MDSKQFDELVARLAAGPSRRDALKGIVGGALASVGAVSVAESKGKKGKQDNKKGKKGKQDSKKGGKGKQGAAGVERRRKKKCRLQPGQTRCSKKICVDLKTNSSHCGGCFRQCSGATPFCKNSVCSAYG